MCVCDGGGRGEREGGREGGREGREGEKGGWKRVERGRDERVRGKRRGRGVAEKLMGV